MDEITRKIADELKAKRAEAAEKWQAVQTAQKEAEKEAKEAGKSVYDYLNDADTFDKMDSVHKDYDAVKQAIGVLEDRLGAAASWTSNGPSGPPGEGKVGSAETKTEGFKLGDIATRFFESDAYKQALPHIQNWEPGQKLHMDPVEVITESELKNLFERKTLVTGASATSAGAMVVNEHIPGLFVDIPFRPFRVLDLIPKATTDSDTVEYVSRTSRTNNAAETAEATSSADGALPESATAFAVNTTAVQLIGHFIPATTRALEDEGQLRGLLENDLVGGVFNRLDTQLVSGNGSSPNLRGILNTSNIQTQALGSDSRSDAFHKAMTAIRIDSAVNDNLMPDAVVLHPSDAEDMYLEKNANGDYVYGAPSAAERGRIWGLPIVESLALTAGTGIVGAFRQGARLWIRRGISVSATESHDDWFIREIVAIKATMRAAFAAYYPDAFAQVTGL